MGVQVSSSWNHIASPPYRPGLCLNARAVTEGGRITYAIVAVSQRDPAVSKALPTPDHPERQSSGEHAAVDVRRLIFDGRLRPGERIPQEQIAQALGVSRIPVREALIALEREGWVTLEMHRGAFVNALDEQAARDSYELFGLVYEFAVRRAMGRGSTQIAAQLYDIARQIARTESPEDIHRLTIAFHAAIVDAAASPRIKVVLRAMSGLLPGNSYECVILHALVGDPTLFIRGDAVEHSWRIVDPIIARWATSSRRVPLYEAGSWGPDEADRLLESVNRRWRTPGDRRNPHVSADNEHASRIGSVDAHL